MKSTYTHAKKKKWGQNFLTDLRVCDKMVLAGEVKNSDVVIEVGPGEGVLTAKLLKAGAKVIAIEKDRDLAPLLEEKFKKEIKNRKLKLIIGDVRDIPIKTLGVKNHEYKVVANIPYYISGLLLRLFLESEIQPTLVTFLVQKEVAERVTKNDKRENLLSLSIGIFGTPKLMHIIKKGAFNPSPKVDSAILQIKNLKKPFKTKGVQEYFFTIIRRAFQNSRKQLGHTFKKDAAIKKFLTENDISLARRPETIPLQTWKELACDSHSKKDRIEE